MGEIRRVSLARGKRVIKVAPMTYGRDPASVATLAIRFGAGDGVVAHLTDDERRSLIVALGGEVA